MNGAVPGDIELPVWVAVVFFRLQYQASDLVRSDSVTFVFCVCGENGFFFWLCRLDEMRFSV